MPRRGLVKCSSLFFIVFLMCPRRIRPTPPKHEDFFQALRRSSKDILDVNVKFGPADWSNIVRQNHDEEVEGDDNEPGFDLSDDEIRKFKLWPKGIVPYYIDVPSFNDKVLRDRIRLFLNTVNSLTKLSFLEMPAPPSDEETRWVFFANRRGQLGCSDHSILNFTNEGVQHVILGYDCISTGGELAEAVLSIAGVPPQHNSPDRDQYIKVIEDNIMPEKKYLFHKLSDDQWLFHGVNYDFSSAGHFHHHKHSATGHATIEFEDSHSTHKSMGENRGFTKSDIKKLRMLYNYIVKKKENKVPECDKLFRKGLNFHQGAVSFPEPKPRKKPNKYLGLPEEKHEDKHNENEEYSEDLEGKDHEDKDHEKDTKEGRDSKAEEHKGSEDGSNDAENYNEDPPTTRKMDLKSHPVKGKQKSYKIDLLSYLSDYKSGDERRRKAVNNKTLKSNK